MSTAVALSRIFTLKSPSSSIRTWRFAGLTFLALALLVFVVTALFPSWLAPAPPLATDPDQVLQAPSGAHLLGTDQVGRDLLSRIIFGARYSLVIGIGSVLLSAVAGVALGVLSGLAPRGIDEIITRVLDVINAFPEILLALVVISIAGRGPVNVVIAVGVAGIPRFARVVRAQVFVIKRADFMDVALTQGLSYPHRIVKHLVPNILGPVFALATIGTAGAIVNAAGLSFLGLGPQPPTPEWGAMLSDGRNYFESAWWVAVFPGLAIVAVVLVVTIVGRITQARFDGAGS
ncbi:MAG: ABC transporter permease [Gordonia sp. (in: high G+C Gram-positive bacteria)]